jgi:hypothetical protein
MQLFAYPAVICALWGIARCPHRALVQHDPGRLQVAYVALLLASQIVLVVLRSRPFPGDTSETPAPLASFYPTSILAISPKP